MTKNVRNDTICGSMKIQRVEPEDIKQVLEIEKLSFKDPWSRFAFESELLNTDSIFLKAVIESKLIGYIIVRKLVDEFHIMNVAVTPEKRKQGIAQALLDHVMKNLSSGKLLLLEVRKSNKEAIALYQKNGFSILHTRKGYYSDGEDATVMTKELPEE
jgi:[ribosomal protein S18]-alanine N-acetyltransferase